MISGLISAFSEKLLVEQEELIRPLRRGVLLRVDIRPMVRASGVYLPSESWEPMMGWVVARSDEVKDLDIGDYVLYRIYSGAKFTLANIPHVIVTENDIEAVIQNEG